MISCGRRIVSNEALAHVLQERDGERGFFRKPGSVSFGTLGDVGDFRAEARVVEDRDVLPEAVRAVVVPILVPAPGCVALADHANEEILGRLSGRKA